MKRRIFALLAGLAFAGAVGAQTTLNVITAGDQNMVDYVNNYLAPKFEAANPGVKVRAVGTGPGDAGSQKIYEKLSAQQKAGSNEWDVDVAVIHQLASATMVKEKLLMPYRGEVAVGKLVTRDTAKNALGADVDGYVLPMFQESTAVLRGAERMGEEEPEAVRLQRRQRRDVGRRIRDRLGVRLQRYGRQAGEGSL
jgi:putative spermidine/putrescine transport system substrate-binding protein